MDITDFQLNDVHDIRKISKEIGISSRSVRNRLFSVIHDNDFITGQVLEAYNNRPVVPNKRCGLWYVQPSQRADTCYFKSTDGHNTQWDFSVKRLNLHLIPLIVANNGIVIVDSTRRGKKMPDSFSKTIPIWCCCINAIVFGDGSNIELFVPPQTVSAIERDNILRIIPQLITKIKSLNILDKVQLDKPLRPLWCFPGSVPYDPLTECEEFHPVICCTASLQSQDGELHLNQFDYVQGAADDHELWCPEPTFNDDMFWNNVESFKTLTTDTEMKDLISDIVKNEQKSSVDTEAIQDITRFPNTRYSIGKIAGELRSMPSAFQSYERVVIFTDLYKTDFLNSYEMSTTNPSSKIIFIPLSANKKYFKKFREILGPLIESLRHLKKSDILILCENGQDYSVAVALCLLCLNYDLKWNECENPLITKHVIKSQLINIINVKNCNPQRNVLNSCNAILM